MAKRKNKVRRIGDGFVYEPDAEHTLDSFRKRMADYKAREQPAPVIVVEDNVREIQTVRRRGRA